MSRVPVAVVRSTKSAVYKIITVFLFDHYLAWQVHVYKNIIALQANSIRGSQGACRKSRDVHVTPFLHYSIDTHLGLTKIPPFFQFDQE